MIKTGFIVFVLLVFSGCSSYVQISEITSKPREYQDKQVVIKGRVVETLEIPFVHKGMYQIEDDTDKIWVVPRKRVPFRGDKVIVKVCDICGKKYDEDEEEQHKECFFHKKALEKKGKITSTNTPYSIEG